MKKPKHSLRAAAWGALISSLVAALPAWAVDPFTVRDIQFNDPQIIVLRLASIEVFGELPGGFHLLSP